MRSPEGQAAAVSAAAAAPPLTSEEARQQAQAERGADAARGRSRDGLLVFGVCLKPGRSKPYEARVKHGGKLVHLGSFATAEEAALCVARSPYGRRRGGRRRSGCGAGGVSGRTAEGLVS